MCCIWRRKVVEEPWEEMITWNVRHGSSVAIIFVACLCNMHAYYTRASKNLTSKLLALGYSLFNLFSSQTPFVVPCLSGAWEWKVTCPAGWPCRPVALLFEPCKLYFHSRKLNCSRNLTKPLEVRWSVILYKEVPLVFFMILIWKQE